MGKDGQQSTPARHKKNVDVAAGYCSEEISCTIAHSHPLQPRLRAKWFRCVGGVGVGMCAWRIVTGQCANMNTAPSPRTATEFAVHNVAVEGGQVVVIVAQLHGQGFVVVTRMYTMYNRSVGAL